MANKSNEINWFPSTEFPDELNAAQRRFSVDVLVYCPKAKEHSIAWYDHISNEWLFLCREVNFKTFQWRYFTDEHDRTTNKKIK